MSARRSVRLVRPCSCESCAAEKQPFEKVERVRKGLMVNGSQRRSIKAMHKIEYNMESWTGKNDQVCNNSTPIDDFRGAMERCMFQLECEHD